tara:strand:- start:2908 stop:3147 length:240 start_codon:yes stop_codon:yes gene_type:complete
MKLNNQGLSKNDKLKNRVLIAKSNIPLYKIAEAFQERYSGEGFTDKQVKQWLNLQGSNKVFTEALEEMAGSFTNLNRKK